jgi:hypothetical protein
MEGISCNQKRGTIFLVRRGMLVQRPPFPFYATWVNSLRARHFLPNKTDIAGISDRNNPSVLLFCLPDVAIGLPAAGTSGHITTSNNGNQPDHEFATPLLFSLEVPCTSCA